MSVDIATYLGEGLDTSWKVDSACRDLPTEMFFPDDHRGNDRLRYREAVAVCRTCTVRVECLDYALTVERQVRGSFGVFGGLTPRERHDIMNRRAS